MRLLLFSLLFNGLLSASSAPKIKDWQTLLITLDRSGCFGACPSYMVQIHGNGTVHFEGRNFVATSGQHQGRISIQAVKKLVKAFRDPNYFLLNDSYSATVTDLPTYKISLRFDRYSKSITDYGGKMAGMPQQVEELERKIDEAAGTDYWIRSAHRIH